ncbi:MAG: isoprenylcysteine carboxylmethyltransferase family protein [Edaphobacter sp.]
MKATAFEFRFRFLIYFVIFLLGFTAPWDRILSAETGRTAWLILAAWPAHNHWLSFSASTLALLALAILCAVVAAALRTWSSAYLGANVVKAHTMQGEALVAAGPYRYLRNPLYLGTFIHTLALALLMPPSGALFCILAIAIFQLRLIAGEEAFLAAKLGDPYRAYCARVPRLLPALTPRVPASAIEPTWPSAFLGEIYMWGVVVTFAVAGWRYNAFVVIQGVIVSLGVSFIARAFLPKR